MLETDTLRQVLQTQAINACAANSFKCQIGNEPFVQPIDGSLYGMFWFRTGKTKQIELTGVTGFEVTAGIVQFSIYAPEKTGDGPGMQMGDKLRALFSRKQWQVPPNGYVTMGALSVQTLPGTRDGVVTYIVDGPFAFYHQNPDATPS